MTIFDQRFWSSFFCYYSHFSDYLMTIFCSISNNDLRKNYLKLDFTFLGQQMRKYKKLYQILNNLHYYCNIFASGQFSLLLGASQVAVTCSKSAIKSPEKK